MRQGEAGAGQEVQRLGCRGDGKIAQVKVLRSDRVLALDQFAYRRKTVSDDVGRLALRHGDDVVTDDEGPEVVALEVLLDKEWAPSTLPGRRARLADRLGVGRRAGRQATRTPRRSTPAHGPSKSDTPANPPRRFAVRAWRHALVNASGV